MAVTGEGEVVVVDRVGSWVPVVFNQALNILKGKFAGISELLEDTNAQTAVLDVLEDIEASRLEEIALSQRSNKQMGEVSGIMKLGILLARSQKYAVLQKARAEQSKQEANIDPLTGLYNRRFMEEYLPHELARIAREKSDSTKNPGMAVLTLDLDNFKPVNDTWGHDMGDKVLRIVAQSLKIRAQDVAVRDGGDEFRILMPTQESTQLKTRVFGPIDTYKGNYPGSLLAEINAKIDESIKQLESLEGNSIWKPVIFDGVPTYISAGLFFMGSGSLQDKGMEKIRMNAEYLLKKSDQEEKIAKKKRKVVPN